MREKGRSNNERKSCNECERKKIYKEIKVVNNNGEKRTKERNEYRKRSKKNIRKERILMHERNKEN